MKSSEPMPIKYSTVTPLFRDYHPGKIRDCGFYICRRERIYLHNCPCGCGIPVEISFDDERFMVIYSKSKVSVTPSIHNPTAPCKSHYYITGNKIIWC